MKCHFTTAQNNIGVIVYSPMASGPLTGKITGERIANLPDDDWRKRGVEVEMPPVYSTKTLLPSEFGGLTHEDAGAAKLVYSSGEGGGVGWGGPLRSPCG